MDKIEHLFGWTWLGNYNPISVGWQECDPGHHFGPGVREFRVIHYVLSGKGILRIKNKEYQLKAGYMFSLPIYETVYYEADTEDPWEYVWISFVNNETATYLFEDYVVYAPNLRTLFLDVKYFEDYEGTGKVHAAKCLNNIAEQLMEKKSSDTVLVDDAIQYIQQHYSSSALSVTEIADFLKVSRYKLSAAFSNEKGISPVQYIIQYRMEKACKYMLEDGIPPTVVSNSVGYLNYPQFFKIFRKYIGVTPTEYLNRKEAACEASSTQEKV